MDAMLDLIEDEDAQVNVGLMEWGSKQFCVHTLRYCTADDMWERVS